MKDLKYILVLFAIIFIASTNNLVKYLKEVTGGINTENFVGISTIAILLWCTYLITRKKGAAKK